VPPLELVLEDVLLVRVVDVTLVEVLVVELLVVELWVVDVLVLELELLHALGLPGAPVWVWFLSPYPHPGLVWPELPGPPLF
jgi:hypothetical protein